MAYYRLYFLTDDARNITGVVQFDASGDRSAIEYAEQYVGPAPLDLWNTRQRVRLFDTITAGATPRRVRALA